MKLPCENALWYVLPQVRADIARELVKAGMKQKDIASLIGVTPAAVSQYLNKKRAGKIKTSKEYMEKIRESAKRIKESDQEMEIMNIVCSCCKAGSKK
ncbi:transcriptional regulator [Candidatus Altiarchaeota archaeon]